MDSELTLNIDELLLFFDERPMDSRGHASAVVPFIGEELGASLLCRYYRAQGCTARILTKKGTAITPTPGTNKGGRLDRWVLTKTGDNDPTLYQVEVKNWSAHSYGGKVLNVAAAEDEIRVYRMNRWQDHWNEDKCDFRDDEAAKVLVRMKPPSRVDDETGRLCGFPFMPDERVEPLICFWWPVHSEGQNESLWFCRFQSGPINGFRGVWVFSMSNYLRSVRASGVPRITLAMPITEQRVAWLDRFFGRLP